ncbi:MAG: ImmA/IrrE family metallo-endopeptidase [Oscillospiraceae bacterium]|nr:ImmA/IrrE family metallo-endopeptidase [Oscillospiraceae bacterium]
MERIQVYLMTVQFSKEEMQQMEKLVKTFLDTMEIECVVPIDIFKVATDLGFDVRGAEFEEQLEGLIIVNEYIDKIGGFDSNKIIAYNCSKDINTKKFIVAHELAHYISKKTNAYGKKIVVAARDHVDSYSEDREEQRMDYIAASLLIPKNDLCQFLNSNTNALQVAERYKVPKELAQRRIEEVQE